MQATAAHVALGWLVAASVAASTAACASGPAETGAPGPSHERTTTVVPALTPVPDPDPARSESGTPVQLTMGGTTISGELWDNPAARDLAARLPLTLTFGDYQAVEKTSRLDPALTMDGMPTGDDPNPGELGWYAPSSDLVLYYGDVGYWNGIARLGTFDSSGIALLVDGPGEVTVTIASSDG